MKVAGLAFGLFFAAFVLHWLMWRVRIPRHQTASLLLLLLGMLPVGLAVMWLSPCRDVLGPWEALQIAIFHVGMSLAYIVAYSALEQRSPSMALLVDVAQSRGRGRTRDELVAVLKNSLPVEVRLAALVQDNMISLDDGQYRLQRKGRRWAQVFTAWRHLLKMDKGG